MQDCFRLHPEVYGDELADDEEQAPAAEGAEDAGLATAKTASPELGVGSPTSDVVDAKPDAKSSASDEQSPAIAPTKKPEAKSPTSEAP
jgi:mitochondrial intermembrane space import and assembly protein 40